MKILIIGNGAREHAIAHRLRRENPRAELVAVPGNPGLGELSVRCLLEERIDSLEALRSVALKERPDLVVVGPEAPLSIGVVDMLAAESIAVVGPTKAAAQLECSKSFAKEVMNSADVPTAKAILTRSPTELDSALTKFGLPVVLKADGLAAGKGVVVCHTQMELSSARKFLAEDIGATEILVEEFLHGVEATLMVATNGEDILVLPAAHDYKRIGDGDTGPNTGGMGSVSPTPRLSPHQIGWCVDKIVKPVLAEMRRRDTPFTGFLYVGLMIDPQSHRINVVEFNARMGDPETQSVLAMLSGSFTEGLYWIANKPIAHENPTILPPTWGVVDGVAVSVVAASEGYPGVAANNFSAAASNGAEIDGILLALNLPGVAVYQAGTKLEARRLVTNGGRVLTVTARGSTVAEARRLVYRALDVIQFKGRQARRDIGSDSL